MKGASSCAPLPACLAAPWGQGEPGLPHGVGKDIFEGPEGLTGGAEGARHEAG